MTVRLVGAAALATLAGYGPPVSVMALGLGSWGILLLIASMGADRASPA